jgi:hypothetical protein
LVEDSADEIAMLFKILEEIESTLEVSVCRDGLEALDTLMTAGVSGILCVRLDKTYPRRRALVFNQP